MAKRAAPKQDVPTAPAPRNYAVRAIAGLLAPVVRPIFKKRAPAAAALLADWPAFAGAALAARAAPVKLASGTLTLACAGPVALELQHQAPELIARLNLALGARSVERLRFVATTSEQQRPALPAAAELPMAPLDGLPDGPLGEALARLYQGIRSRPN